MPRPLLGGVGSGGVASLRGHRVGARAGDRLAAASVELRRPLNSTGSFAKVGVKLFFDTGATYNVNERLGQTRFSQGAGAGVFLNVAFLTVQLDAARDLRGGARLHIGTGVSFQESVVKPRVAPRPARRPDRAARRGSMPGCM